MKPKFEYTQPGMYVAICNKGNFYGHYIKMFEFPSEDERIKEEIRRIVFPGNFGVEKLTVDNFFRDVVRNQTPAWWFLNRVNFVACLEAVYPIEIFEKLFAEVVE